MVQKRVVRQWIAAITCSLSAAMVASCFVSTLFRLPQEAYTHPHIHWISSIMPLGTCIFAIPAGMLADKFGRKAMLLQASPLVVVSWIVESTTSDLVASYIVRFIQGLAMAIVYVVAPIYLVEMSETSRRGLFTGQFQTMYLIGAIYGYVIGLVSWLELSYVFDVCAQMVIPIATIIVFYTMPESPYFLIASNKSEQALDALQWFRGTDDVIDELTVIKESLRRDMLEKPSFRNLVRSDADKRALSIVMLLSVLRPLFGMSVISVYLLHILNQDADGIFSSPLMAIVLTIITALITFIFTFFVDSVGRKPILVLTTVGITAFNFIIAVFYGLGSILDDDSWILYIALVGLSISCNVGLGGIMQVVQGEYFPYRTRALGGAIATMVSSFFMFVILVLYNTLKTSYGNELNFSLYTFASLIGVFVFPVAYHETAGRPLAQIQNVGICRKKSSSQFVSTISDGIQY